MATLRAHILSADWFGGALSILADAGGLVQLQPGPRIDWTIGQERACVGRITRDGHVSCPHQAAVQHDAQCSQCAPDWLPCVFEPLEHVGPCPLCDREHVVYMAFYGGLPKVGMTSAARIGTRLMEQGADAYFVVQRRRDRSRARQTEQTVSRLYGVPEFRRHAELLHLWTRPVDEATLVARAQDWQARLGERFDVEALVRVPAPMRPLPRPATRVRPEGHHIGRWLGARGDHLFYEADASPLPVGGRPVLALQRSALPGRFIHVA